MSSPTQADPLGPARDVLARYRPRDAHQAEMLERMLAFMDRNPSDAHCRELLEGHLTAAAFLLDSERERALLTHHRKLGRWLQLGGHCDGDPDLVRVALKEGLEESGIEGLTIDPMPIDLDIHPIPARPAKGGKPAEPAHFHYDVRFVVTAPPGAVEVVSEESLALGWFAPDELDAIDLEASVRRLFELAF